MLLASGVSLLQPTRPWFTGSGGITIAADPTPAPSVIPPTAIPTTDPTVAPTTDPTATPSADPTVTLPTASPTESVIPTPDPSAIPTANPTATPDPISSPIAGPLVRYALTAGQQIGSIVGEALPIYDLIVLAAPLVDGSPHVSSGLEGSDCASCHSTHTAAAPALAKVAPQAELCYQCHASGDTFDIRTAFTSAPVNDPATASYFSHPVADASAALHVLGTNDEFGGLSNRHAVCADCHNPHDATTARPAQSTTGWTASGDIAGASGVAVTNGAAGEAPAYALVSRDVGGGSLTYEYQLCLKCHSGQTTLPVRSATRPSWWALDKGIEFNPANNSYHPVEAAGRNLSAQLAGSLAGTSPFKAWNLTVDSTVRCVQCHGDPSTVDQTAAATPKSPAGDAYEASHASPNRGLLIAPYTDRTLKAVDAPYDATDFGLCYLCHAERPFTDSGSNAGAVDTAFSLHGLHVNGIGGVDGAGLSIDTAGAGEGRAICAECHFRIHSTAIAYKPGDTAPVARSTGYGGLVNFAPNVTGVGLLAPTWVQPSTAGQGSCTLTCHGYTHATRTYTVAPGTGFVADRTSGPVGALGLDVQFTDATRYVTTSGATWAWTFGDGGTSTLVNPSHTYATPGTYAVSLTVRRTSGSTVPMTMTRTDYITVTP